MQENYNNNQGTVRRGPPDIERIVNNANDVQLMIMEKWSRLVGKILSNIEICLPEGRQYLVLKKFLNTSIYNARNSLLRFFVHQDGHNYEEIENKLNTEVNKMIAEIDARLEMVFTSPKQQKAVKDAVAISIQESVEEIMYYFSPMLEQGNDSNSV
jgi:predicted transcriptional regulator